MIELGSRQLPELSSSTYIYLSKKSLISQGKNAYKKNRNITQYDETRIRLDCRSNILYGEQAMKKPSKWPWKIMVTSFNSESSDRRFPRRAVSKKMEYLVRRAEPINHRPPSLQRRLRCHYNRKNFEFLAILNGAITSRVARKKWRCLCLVRLSRRLYRGSKEKSAQSTGP